MVAPHCHHTPIMGFLEPVGHPQRATVGEKWDAQPVSTKGTCLGSFGILSDDFLIVQLKLLQAAQTCGRHGRTCPDTIQGYDTLDTLPMGRKVGFKLNEQMNE